MVKFDMPCFIITIDTEGDNMWRQLCSKRDRKRITIKNGAYIERFQNLCEKFNFIPTYLVDYEMTQSIPFIEMSKQKLKDKKLEIGMHMHAWTVPPDYELKIAPGYKGNPYVYEYPDSIIRKKVRYLTKTLEDIFEEKITSHRSGRWYFDKEYAGIIKENGYLVDCSVTPGINWRSNEGVTRWSKGPDYKNFPAQDYEMSLHNIKKRGESGLYEVPVSTASLHTKRFGFSNKVMMRPNGHNLKDLLYIAEEYKILQTNYIEFMLHSSELMPGGSPYFRDKRQIEQLYDEIESFFAILSGKYIGSSLTGYVKKRYGIGMWE